MRSLLLTLAALPLAFTAPVNNERALHTEAGKYIVVYKNGQVKTGDTARDLTSAFFPKITKEFTYNMPSFKGFSADLTAEELSTIQADSSVAFVEPDGLVHTQQTTLTTQSNAPWGLGRISSRTKGSTDYVYDASAGSGTCSYIIDTGIDATHPEFEGRATSVKSFVSGATTDDNGHGSHVAGTIGSKSYGVAKKTKLYGIKVLNSQGSGSWSTVISGIEYAVTDSQSRSCPNGVVVNMSLGGSPSQALDQAVAEAVSSGLFFAVAAGNDGANLSTSSPARVSTVFAVGASDIDDNIAYFSNFGSSLGAFAPGVDVLSTWKNGGTNTISGTSMATPHIAGLGAYLLGLQGKVSPAALGTKIKNLATSGVIVLTSDAAGTPNRLAYNGASA